MGSALVTLVGLVVLLLVLEAQGQVRAQRRPHLSGPPIKRHSAGAVFWAWSPYVILVVMVLLWGVFKAELNKVSWRSRGRAWTEW